MAYYALRDRYLARSAPVGMVYQGPPPALEADVWIGEPSTVASTTQMDDLVATGWSGDLDLFIWTDRANILGKSNTRPNPLPPTAATGTLKRSRPLDWAAGLNYRIGEKVYNPGDTKSYQVHTEHVSAGAIDLTKVTEVTGTTIQVECRTEFSSYRTAAVSNKVKLMFAVGHPETTVDGDGWGDLAALHQMDVHTFAEAETNRDTIFTGRPTDMDSNGAEGYAVSSDVIVLPIFPWADAWTDGEPTGIAAAGALRRKTSDDPPTFWRSLGGGTWRRIHISVTFDHEVSDQRPKTEDDDIPRGEELTSNGGFDGPSSWTLGAGWTIADGVATHAPGAAATVIDQPRALTTGRTYEFTYTVSGRTVGNCFCRLSGIATVQGIARTADGTYTEVLTATADHSRFGVVGGSTFDGSIDNVSVVEVGEIPGVPEEWERVGNVGHFYEFVAPIARSRGFKIGFYTNDWDPANGVSANNGFDETNINRVIGAVDEVTLVSDGDNLRGDSILGNLVTQYNRIRYVNGDKTQGQRTNWDAAKVIYALEMVERHAHRQWPIASISVGAGPGYLVTVTAPGNNFGGNSFINIRSVLPASLNGVYRVAGGTVNAALGTFGIDQKVTALEPRTGSYTMAAVDGSALAAYVGGGTAATGGTSLGDWIDAKRFILAKGMRMVDGWRNGAVQGQNEPDVASYAITNITRANPAVVTTSAPHPFLPTGSADAKVKLDAVRGMTQVNGLIFAVGTVTATTFQLLGFNSTNLSAYTGGGRARSARRIGVNKKQGAVLFNLGQMPTLVTA